MAGSTCRNLQRTALILGVLAGVRIVGTDRAQAAAGPKRPAVTVSPAHAKQGPAYGRAVAQLPDWNGVWQSISGLVFDPTTAVNAHDDKRGTDFGNAGGAYMRPPYNAKWQAEYDFRIKETAEGRARDPTSDCRVEGFPRMLQVPAPLEIVVLPKVVFMNLSYFDQGRRIYTDGRPHPPRDTAYPRELGHSVGRWEGDTLVVDTVDMTAFNYDQTEAPYSDEIHVVERLRVLDDGLLEDEITITDPVMLTRPWRVVRQWKRAPAEKRQLGVPGPDWTDVESIFCTNNRNLTDANGVESLQLPGEVRPSR